MGRERLYWSVQYSGLACEELTLDQYCLSLYTCLHQGKDRDRFYAALDELAWMQTYLRLQVAQPGARLAASVFDQELANLKARLLELVREKDMIPSPAPDPLREYADTCASRGARVDQADTEFHYTPTGALFCHEHYLGWLAAQPSPRTVDALYADEAMARAQEKRGINEQGALCGDRATARQRYSWRV